MRAVAMAWIVLGACTVACGGAAVGHTPELSREDWSRGVAELARLRATMPSTPYVVEVRVTMHEPKSGKTMDGRGAVAVDPHRAMRMILVGPGGGTALDAWVTNAAWRMAIPAIEVVRKGAAETPPGLPIGFFRWWFLAPLDGNITYARADGDEGRFVLRPPDATVALATRGSGPALAIHASRKSLAGDTDRIDWKGASLAPHVGDRAVYVQEKTGLRVDVVIDAVKDGPPEPAAFEDPEQGGAN